MKLWLITTVVICLINFIALATIGKNYKSNGLIRGATFASIFALWGLVSTLWLNHEGHWLYYPCGLLSAILTGITFSMLIMIPVRLKREKQNHLDKPIASFQRKVS